MSEVTLTLIQYTILLELYRGVDLAVIQTSLLSILFIFKSFCLSRFKFNKHGLTKLILILDENFCIFSSEN